MPPEAEGPAIWLDKARRDLRMAELAQAQGLDRGLVVIVAPGIS